MVELRKNNKGIVLVIVLATILVSVLLATAVMNLITNQSRLTHHQLSRIQAYYASKAAVTYAQEMLRIGLAAGGWAVPAAGTSTTYSTSTGTNFGFNLATDFRPASITEIELVITPAQNTVYISGIDNCYRSPLDTKVCITCKSTYTYTP